MFRLVGAVLHRYQPMFHYLERTKQRRSRELFNFAFHSEALPHSSFSSRMNDLLRLLPFVSNTTPNNGLFKRLESVSDAGRMTDVTFRVPLRDSRAERVVLVGNSQEFGKWGRSNAFPLRWTPGNVWTGQLRLQKGTYEFKIVGVRNGKEDHENGENRVLVIDERPSAGSEMEVTMEFGKTLSSNAVKIIRETIVLGKNGHELYRVPSELHKLKQTPDPNSVVDYFKSVLQLDEKDIESLFQQRSSLKSMSVEVELKPWVEYLGQEVKSPYSWIGTLIKRNPKLLNVPVEKLAPVVEFLLHDIGVPTEKLRRFLERSRTWHYQSFEEKFKPRIQNLRQITGLNNSDLGRIIAGDVGSRSLHDAELEQHFEDLRFRLNLGKKEFADLIARCPRLLFTKPSLVSKKLEYLTKKLNRGVGEIVAFPSALVYSSDEKIKERFEYLERNGVPHSSYSLYKILLPSKETFKSMVQNHLRKIHQSWSENVNKENVHFPNVENCW